MNDRETRLTIIIAVQAVLMPLIAWWAYNEGYQAVIDIIKGRF